MRSIRIALALSIVATAGVYAFPVDPRVYCDTDLTYNSFNVLTSRASASYSDNWGNPAPANLTGWHKISGSDGSTPAQESISTTNSGTWAGTMSAGFNAPSSGQICYQATIYVSSGDASQQAGSGNVCFSAPPPPPPPPPSPTEDTTISSGCDPLILDLNGDGIQTTGKDDAVWFDLNGDGAKEHLTWTNRNTQEGLLYVDLNHKNRVDNGSELFGIGTVIPDGSHAKDGFAALAMYDLPEYGGNSDGVIDANDAIWNHLRVWIDSNHDGVCDPGETAPIHAYGVEQILLRAVRANSVDSAGNTHALRGLYLQHVTDGSRSIYQWLEVDSIAFQRVP